MHNLSAKLRELQVDAHIISRPFKGGKTPENEMVSEHSKFFNGIRKSYAVLIASPEKLKNDSILFGGPVADAQDTRDRASQSEKWTMGRGCDYKHNEALRIFTNPNDHMALIDHCLVGFSDPESTKKENILYHADPFGYEHPSETSGNKPFFLQHQKNTGEIFPVPSVLTRLKIIDKARLQGRKMVKALNKGASDGHIISGVETIGTGAINAVGNTGGGIYHIATASSAAAAVKATAISATVAAPMYIIAQQAEKLAVRYRIKPLENDSVGILSDARIHFPQARHDRDVLIQTIDEAVDNAPEGVVTCGDHIKDEWNITKTNLTDAWNKLDKRTENYLELLTRGLYCDSTSIPKEFAYSLLTLVAHEAKLSAIAESRLLKEAKHIALRASSAHQYVNAMINSTKASRTSAELTFSKSAGDTQKINHLTTLLREQQTASSQSLASLKQLEQQERATWDTLDRNYLIPS